MNQLLEWLCGGDLRSDGFADENAPFPKGWIKSEYLKALG